MDQKKIEYYNHQGGTKKISLKLFGVVAFILILLVLIFTAFSGDGVITGKDIVVNGLNINSELSLTPLELNSVFEEIKLKGSYNSYLNVGGEKFDLSKSNNVIIIEDFDGVVSIDGKNIDLLKGNAMRISVNGVPIMPDTTSSLSTNLEDFRFTSLDITDGVYIDRISYNATGSISIEGTTLNLKNDVLNLEKFYGSMLIEENVMKLNGEIKKISTEGKSKVSISV